MKPKPANPPSPPGSSKGTKHAKPPEPYLQQIPGYFRLIPCAHIPLTTAPTKAKLNAVQRLLEMDERKMRDKLSSAFSGSYDGHLHKDDVTAMLRALGLLPSKPLPGTGRAKGRK